MSKQSSCYNPSTRNSSGDQLPERDIVLLRLMPLTEGFSWEISVKFCTDVKSKVQYGEEIWGRNIAENFKTLSRSHERYRL